VKKRRAPPNRVQLIQYSHFFITKTPRKFLYTGFTFSYANTLIKQNNQHNSKEYIKKSTFLKNKIKIYFQYDKTYIAAKMKKNIAP
jgi:hypothetical protein